MMLWLRPEDGRFRGNAAKVGASYHDHPIANSRFQRVDGAVHGHRRVGRSDPLLGGVMEAFLVNPAVLEADLDGGALRIVRRARQRR
jgi:hypothetical protein